MQKFFSMTTHNTLEIIMSNKTPFEIRLELLHIAKDYLDNAQQAQIQLAKDAFYKSVELGNLTVQQMNEQIRALMPEPYAVDEIVKKAAEMYTFITKKD
jgi:hypothetical protein